MDFDLSKPEQYAAWFLCWWDQATTPIIHPSGAILVRMQTTDPQLEITRLAALTLIDGYLGKMIRENSEKMGKTESDSA